MTAPDTASPPSVAELHHFFDTLYPDVDTGWLVLSFPDPTRLTRQGKPALRAEWFNAAYHTHEDMARRAAVLASTGDVYFGVVVQHPHCTPDDWHRSSKATAYLVPGLWFDLDLAYGAHAASSLPGTDAEALDFLQALPAPPSIIVHSGGGLHAHWLFREPYVITTETERDAIAGLSQQFHYTLREAGKHHGWTLDALGDLARVLRPPGTLNCKYGKGVEVLQESGARYNLSDFDWLIDLPAPAQATHAGAAIAGQPDLVAIAEHYGAVLERKSKTELAGAHPQHGSSTGDNFNVNVEKGLWHCWRHGTGGDALALMAVCEGLIPCEDMRAGALRGETFKRVVETANDKFQAGIALQTRPAVPDMTQAPTPDPDDPAAHTGTLVHRLPDRLRDHPDPRVRKHWMRIYRRTAALKQQLAQRGALL